MPSPRIPVRGKVRLYCSWKIAVEKEPDMVYAIVNQ